MELWLFLTLLLIHLVECKQCWYSNGIHSKIFFCGESQYCCGESCCTSEVPFYTLWYFWLSVVVLFFLCSAGVYWIRKHYIYHKLLAVPGWQTDPRLRQFLELGRGNNMPAKDVGTTGPRLFLLPPYTPDMAPPPYTESDNESPPQYDSLCDTDRKEKAVLTGTDS